MLAKDITTELGLSYLNKREGCRWAFLCMIVPVVSRETIVRPGVRVSTIKTKRVAIMAIYVDGGLLAWSKVSCGERIIGDERYNNTCISGLVFYVAKINRVGELRHVRIRA